MADPERRRRRLRQGHSGGTGGSDGAWPEDRSATTAELHDPVAEPPAPRRGPGPPIEDRDGDRGLRGLIGSGASQVSVGAALRARDAARPTEADMAEAEERLIVVRRNWVPREELPRSGR
jgi:hypothetical protein